MVHKNTTKDTLNFEHRTRNINNINNDKSILKNYLLKAQSHLLLIPNIQHLKEESRTTIENRLRN